jgi:hypothetical protein
MCIDIWSNSTFSQGTSLLQQAIELALFRLQIAVATNVLLANEDVGYSTLVRNLLESVLDGGSIVNLVEFNDERLDALLGQKGFRLFAVRAVRLRKDG